MNGTPQSLRHPTPAIYRAGLLALICIFGLTGCAHRAHLVLPQIAKIPDPPIDLIPVPEPDPPMMVELPEDAEEVEAPDLPSSSASLPVRRRRTTPPAPAANPPAVQPPTQVASAPEPATLAIGELSTGGDLSPQSQQQAKDLIAAIQHRIATLSARIANQQKTQLRQVRYFLKQAQQALTTGDAEGAKTLATKANLLMDDIEKK